MKRFLILLVLVSSCTRRHLHEGSYSCESAQMEVWVDWTNSGITPSDSRGEDYVHRVTLRFFPLDGSAPFDRYLEQDITHDYIDLPVGEYSVVVYNESVDDPYWRETFTFENVDDYDRFLARVVAQDSSLFGFYDKDSGEILSVEALKLASWSLDYLRVTPAMASGMGMSLLDQTMFRALTFVALRPLTTYTTITAQVENLSSAYTIHASLQGLSEVVYMASGESGSSPVTHIMPLTDIVWDTTSTDDGSISARRLTFTHLNADSRYLLDLDVLFVDGSRYTEDLTYDVTDQILGSTKYADEELSATVQLLLPEVNGGIDVDEWGEQEDIVIQ